MYAYLWKLLQKYLTIILFKYYFAGLFLKMFYENHIRDCNIAKVFSFPNDDDCSLRRNNMYNNVIIFKWNTFATCVLLFRLSSGTSHANVTLNYNILLSGTIFLDVLIIIITNIRSRIRVFWACHSQ